MLFILIGVLTVNIDGHELRQCQYRAPNSNTEPYTVMTTYRPMSMNCPNKLQF